MQMSLADLTSFSTAVNAFTDGRFDAILRHAEETIKLWYITWEILARIDLFCTAEFNHAEVRTMQLSIHRASADWLPDVLTWSESEDKREKYIQRIIFLSRYGPAALRCTPSGYQLWPPLLNPASCSVVSCSWRLKITIGYLKDSKSGKYPRDKRSTHHCFGCLHTLWSHLLVHLQRSYSLRMIALINSNVFCAVSADG